MKASNYHFLGLTWFHHGVRFVAYQNLRVTHGAIAAHCHSVYKSSRAVWVALAPTYP